VGLRWTLECFTRDPFLLPVGHRVATAFPRHIGVQRNSAQLIIYRGSRREKVSATSTIRCGRSPSLLAGRVRQVVWAPVLCLDRPVVPRCGRPRPELRLRPRECVQGAGRTFLRSCVPVCDAPANLRSQPRMVTPISTSAVPVPCVIALSLRFLKAARRGPMQS